MTALKQILPKIVKVLNSFKKQGIIQNYALIGGMAVATRGYPRATKDLDFLITAKEDFFREEFLRQLQKKKGYTAKLYRGDFNDPLGDLIRISDKDKTPLIDLILVHWQWQKEMVNSADKLTLKKDICVPIVQAEDLIILKLKAGSQRDLLDAEELMRVIYSAGQLSKERLFLSAKNARVEKELKQLLARLKIS